MTRGITVPVGARHDRLVVTAPRVPGEMWVACRSKTTTACEEKPRG